MDFLTFFIDRGAVSGAFHTSSHLALTRHCLRCLGVIWSAGMLRQKPGSTQINRAFCPERCVEGYSFPSTLRVRKQTLSQTTFYLSPRSSHVVVLKLSVSLWVGASLPCSKLCSLSVRWTASSFGKLCIFSPPVLLPCYFSVCSCFATSSFVRNPFLIYYFCSTEFEGRCAWIHLHWAR